MKKLRLKQTECIISIDPSLTTDRVPMVILGIEDRKTGQHRNQAIYAEQFSPEMRALHPVVLAAMGAYKAAVQRLVG